MKRQLLLLTGSALLLAGWFSVFLLNTVPQQRTLLIIGPTLLLGIGMGILLKQARWKLTTLTLALTALTAIISINTLFPERRIGIGSFQQRQRENALPGHPLEIVSTQQDSAAAFPALEAFADIEIKLFAQLPAAPGSMAFDAQGRLLVSFPTLGAIYSYQDLDHDGHAEQSRLFHVGLDRPTGLVCREQSCFVAEPARLVELRDFDHDGQADQLLHVFSDLPDDGGHWVRPLIEGPNQRLYLAVGSRCNACEESNPYRGTVLVFDLDKQNATVFARGLRNARRLAIAPDDKRLWCTDLGRDELGRRMPPEEINQLVAGGDYGWPWCFGRQLVDPQLGSKQRCSQTLSSHFDLPAHTRPTGMVFGAGLKAPQEFRDSLYVALHGSEQSDPPAIGYKLIRIPYRQGRLDTGGKEFLRGWHGLEGPWGQPLDLAVGQDGNLYLSDDQTRVIYRIHWREGALK